MRQRTGLSPLTQSSRSIAYRFGGMLTGLATHSLIARTLGPATYGLFGLLTSNAQMAGQILDLGTEQNTIRLL